METCFGEIEQSRGCLTHERGLLDFDTLAHDTEVLIETTCLKMEEQIADAGRVAVKRADTVIREHPHQSIGAASGVGLLLRCSPRRAALMCERHKRTRMKP